MTGLNWNDFRQRLTHELTRLPADAYLIVQGHGGLPYVQALRHSGGLDAEAVGSAFLPRPLGAEQKQRMAVLGWHAPDGRHDNWYRPVRLSPPDGALTREESADCGKLAERMVAALREVYGTSSPGELTYQAFQNGPEGGPLTLPGLGIPPDTADPVHGEPAGLLDWPEFTERLARELYGLEPQMTLAVQQRDQRSHYVQAFRGAGIRAEAVSSRALQPELRFAPEVEERLAAAGWQRPAPHPNWTTELPATASPDGFRRLAAMMVAALRDVQGAPTPAELTHEAFSETTLFELVDLGIPPAGPARAAERRPAKALPIGDAGPAAAAPADAAPEGSAPEGTAPVGTAPVGTAPEGPRGDLVDLEARLVAARERRDHREYLRLLLGCELYLPEPRNGESGVAGHLTADLGDGTYLVAFTSPDAMERSLRGRPEHAQRARFTDLVAGWPRPDLRLAVNPGLPSAAYIDEGTVRRLAAPGQDAAIPEGTVLQKVVQPRLVVHYLDGGYDQVAGYMHRLQDVVRLHTPDLLLRRLGLLYSGSPFSAGAEEIHVIRWAAVRPGLYKASYGGTDEIPEFKADSHRLPHGAEMYRIAWSGERSLVAVYDTDLRGWRSG